jgi:hypothetical protein
MGRKVVRCGPWARLHGQDEREPAAGGHDGRLAEALTFARKAGWTTRR